jgi:acetyl esterase/lipase
MRQEKIDLYAAFGLQRKGKEEGYLRTYALESNWEMGTNRKFPSLLVIPGGGYGMCSEREGEPIVLPFLKEGISGFVLNYTCAPDGYYPTCLLEAYMAFIYLQENAEKYHLDPLHIAAIGFSAGAHLCGLLSLLHDQESDSRPLRQETRHPPGRGGLLLLSRRHEVTPHIPIPIPSRTSPMTIRN